MLRNQNPALGSPCICSIPRPPGTLGLIRRAVTCALVTFLFGFAAASTAAAPQAQAFLERKDIGLVDLKPQVGFLDPGSGRIDPKKGIACGYLLEANDNFHGADHSCMRL